MTPRKRIMLNIVATYGRSLYSLVVGLYAGRWILSALGVVDYGLVGVVGGLILFVSFLNGLFSTSVTRFYSVSVGAANIALNPEAALEECRKWFNTALLIHSVIPTILIIVGYPVGEWGVRHFLNIPPDRIEACVWVWRFTCVSCFFAMLNVPFQAMYTAKQEIAELTLYSLITTTLNAIFFYYIARHPGFWLVKYSLWTCGVSIVPQLIIGISAVIRYRECRFVAKYLWNTVRVRRITSYAAARLWNVFADVFAGQGLSIMVNKFVGPVFNASMTLGTNVASQSATLSSAVNNALWPAIGNAAGEGDVSKVRKLTFLMCKACALLLIVFALPLALESHEVMVIWLKEPPVFAAEICIAVLVSRTLGCLCDGYWMAIMALGRGVWKYNFVIGWTGFVRFLLAWIMFVAGYKMWGVFIAIILSSSVAVAIRLWMGQTLVGLEVSHWLKAVFYPILLVVVGGLLSGAVPRFLMEPSLLRVLLTTACALAAALPTAWFVVLTDKERDLIKTKTISFGVKMKGGVQ